MDFIKKKGFCILLSIELALLVVILVYFLTGTGFLAGIFFVLFLILFYSLCYVKREKGKKELPEE